MTLMIEEVVRFRKGMTEIVIEPDEIDFVVEHLLRAAGRHSEYLDLLERRQATARAGKG